MRGDVLEWLLEGDPAVVWQVQRDLLARPKRHAQVEVHFLHASIAVRARCTAKERARAARHGATARPRSPRRWQVSLWSGAWSDTCVTAMLLSMALCFERRRDRRVVLRRGAWSRVFPFGEFSVGPAPRGRAAAGAATQDEGRTLETPESPLRSIVVRAGSHRTTQPHEHAAGLRVLGWARKVGFVAA